MFAILLLLLDVKVRDFGVFICVVFKQVHVYKYRTSCKIMSIIASLHLHVCH